MTADARLLKALASLAPLLRDRPHGMVIGGLAVAARGAPRLTEDVDATIWGESHRLGDLLEDLRLRGFIPRIPDALSFAEQHQVLLLRHSGTDTPLDLSLAWLPFEREALERATVVDFGGVSIPVASTEDLIIYKAIAWRDRDRLDIERLVRVHHRFLDMRRITEWVGQFSSALDDPGRLSEFNALVARVLNEIR